MRMSTGTQIIKKNQTEILELKNTIIELKNSQEGFKSRLKQEDERINKLEKRAFEIIEFEQ